MKQNNQKQRTISLILCGLAPDEYRKDAGGIQIAEVSFCNALAQDKSYKVTAFAAGSTTNTVINNEGVCIESIALGGFDRQGGIFDSVLFAQKTAAQLTEKMLQKEDVIHFTSIGPAMIFMNENFEYFKSSKDITTKFFYTMHNFHYAIADKPYDIFALFPEEWEFMHNSELNVVKRADCVIVTSKQLSDELTKRLGRTIEYIPNTIGNLEDYNVSPFNRTHQHKILLTLCRLAGEKNLLRTAEAFAEAYKSDSSIRWIIGGTGEVKDEVVQLLDALNIKHCELPQNNTNEDITRLLEDNLVIFAGQVEGERKSYLLNLADIFILVSLREVSPLVGMEALVYGKLIVSSNIAGWKDFNDFGAASYISSPTDQAAITNNILEACKVVGTERQTEAYDHNRHVYNSNFTPSIIVQQRTSLYDKYLG